MNKKISSHIRSVALIIIACSGIQHSFAMQTDTPAIPPYTPERQIQRPQGFPTPASKITPITNFNRKIIENLANGDDQTFIRNFPLYFHGLPHNLKISDKRFYQALFLSLTQLFSIKPYADDFYNWYVPIKTNNGELFILKFAVIDSQFDAPQTPIKFVLEESNEPLPILEVRIDIATDPSPKIFWVKPQVLQEIVPVYLQKNCFAIPHYNEKNPLRVILSALEGLNNNSEESKAAMACLIDFHLQTFYSSIPENLHIKSEKFYQALFTYTMMFIRYGTIDQETRIFQGRSDNIIDLPSKIVVIEFKYKGSAKKALKQIDDKKYCLPFVDAGKPIWKIGLNITKRGFPDSKLEQFEAPQESLLQYRPTRFPCYSA